MPATSDPDDWVHRPEQVEVNAKRFDDLCRVAEEVAFPVVENALFREYRETAASGAEILTDEAKHALRELAEEAAILDELDENEVLEAVQKSLDEAITPPDEDECREHAREVSQMLMSAWLEILRSAQSKDPVVLLSDRLIPEIPSSGMTRFVNSIKDYIGAEQPQLPPILTEAIGWSAVSEDDAVNVLTTLRQKLFSEPRLVELPFNLAMIGAPGQPVLAGSPDFFEDIASFEDTAPEESEPVIETPSFVQPAPVPTFHTERARSAAAHISRPLARAQYGSMALQASASLQTKSIATQVKQAINTV